MPKISVGLPAYNGEKFIAKAISSVLCQTLADFELIVADDDSIDKTALIVSEFAKSDKRVKFYRHKKNIGFLENYNFVLTKAGTPYFIWIGQDDFWEKTLLEKLHALLNNRKEAVLAVCNTTDVGVSSNFREKYPFQSFTNHESRFESLLKFVKGGNLTYFYGLHRTKNLQTVGGYQKSSRPFFKSSDYATIFRVLLLGPMVFTNEYLFFKTDTGNYLNRYEDLRKLKINGKYLEKVFRYFFFPLLFIYDLLVSFKHVLLSDFKSTQKIMLVVYIKFYFLKRLILYFVSVLYGLLTLIHSFIKHLVNFVSMY